MNFPDIPSFTRRLSEPTGTFLVKRLWSYRPATLMALLALVALASGDCATPKPASLTNQSLPGPVQAEPAGPGYLGIRYHTIPAGLRIVQIIPDSPASRCGLRTGDLIVKAGRTSLRYTQPHVLRQMVYKMRDGESLDLQVQRNGYKIISVTAVIRSLPKYLPH